MNKTIIKTSTLEKVVVRKEAKDSYERVAENIFPLPQEPIFLMPLKKGIADQEKVIAIRQNFPENMGTYNIGEIPNEIQSEFVRMNL